LNLSITVILLGEFGIDPTIIVRGTLIGDEPLSFTE